MLSDVMSTPHVGMNIRFSPPARLSRLVVKDKTIHVVREDLLPGGTKQRAISHFVSRSAEGGKRHFVYASPFCGYAQVALAYVCHELGFQCTLFAERAPTESGPKPLHRYSILAASLGAKVHLADSLCDAEVEAAEFAQRVPGTCLVPLGFNSALFKDAMKEELTREWVAIVKALPQVPQVLWLPVGSGTLAGLFAEFVAPTTRLYCVNVHVLCDKDSRVEALRRNPRVTLFSASQAFAEEAYERPSIPSNLHYDAKLWSFIRHHGQNGDVWWNVGP